MSLPPPKKKNASFEATQEILHNPQKDFESSQKSDKCAHTTHARTGVSKSDRGCIPLGGSIFPTTLEALAAREIEIEDTITKERSQNAGVLGEEGMVEHCRRSEADGVAERALRSPASAAAVTAAEVARLRQQEREKLIHNAPAGRRRQDSKKALSAAQPETRSVTYLLSSARTKYKIPGHMVYLALTHHQLTRRACTGSRTK